MAGRGTQSGQIPRAVQVQFARLFGSHSAEANATSRTNAKWRRSLKQILRELDRYISHNVDTDELHRLLLLSALAAADESLNEDDFWPGYAEGMTRLALLLMGDYPDHRRRRAGRKTTEHYKLDRLRSAQWSQNARQRLQTLLAAGAIGVPELSRSPRDVLSEFRQRYGFRASYEDFLDWYRKVLPGDYAAVFR